MPLRLVPRRYVAYFLSILRSCSASRAAGFAAPWVVQQPRAHAELAPPAGMAASAWGAAAPGWALSLVPCSALRQGAFPLLSMC